MEGLEEFRLNERFSEDRDSRRPNLVRPGDGGHETGGIKLGELGRQGDIGREMEELDEFRRDETFSKV
jgi:hypothetical protein